MISSNIKFVIVVSFFIPTLIFANWQQPPNFESQINAILKKHHIPGAVIGVVSSDDMLYLKGFGVEDLESERPVDSETSVFRVASLSKLITTVAVLQFVDQNQIGLHDDIAPYLDDFKIPSKHHQPITLFHLLTHTAGFDRYNTDPRVLYESDVLPLEASLKKYLLPSVITPGEGSLYSNHGMALAGLVLEKLSGVSFEVCVEANVFQPLDMHRSSFRTEDVHVVQGYRWVPEGVEPVQFEYTQTIPSSMLMTTGGDMCRFLRMVLGYGQRNGYQLLSKQWADSMLTQQFTNYPAFPGMGLGFFEYDYHGYRYFGHGGSITGFHAQVDVFPEKDLAFLLMFNQLRGGQVARHEIESILFETLDLESNQAMRVKSGSIERPLDTFAGHYYFGRHLSQTTAQKWNMYLSNAEVIVRSADNLLLIDDESSDSFFENPDSAQGWRAVGFKDRADGSVGYLVRDDGDVYVRLSVWEYARLNRWIVRGMALLFLSAMFLAFFQKHLLWIGVCTVSVLNGACLLGIHLLSGPNQSGFSVMYRFLLSYPFFAVLCLVWLMWMVWRKSDAQLGRLLKLSMGLLVTGQVMLLVFLNHWNLLGWRFF